MHKPIPKRISEGSIKELLDFSFSDRRIICLDMIDSTNNYAKKLIEQGCDGWTVIVAEGQSNGRGRLGRTWVSPKGKGLYMSVILGPVSGQNSCNLITLGASIAVANSIKKLIGESPKIKWPNDILLDGSKVCGILTEIVLNSKGQNYIVLGIGVNVHAKEQDFPDDIKNKATSIHKFMEEKGRRISDSSKLLLAVGILSEIDNLITEDCRLSDVNVAMDTYRKLSASLGGRVMFINKERECKGIALDIESDGALVIQCDDGEIRKLFSGEVSIRGIMGYVD